jgi:5-methylcytosine-specific restriction endonuclease McrA
MIRILCLLMLCVSPALAEDYITSPRFDLTPGVTRDLTVTQICKTKWGQDARAVTAAMKQHVIDAYNFDVNKCPLTSLKGKRVRRLEIDHLIPRSIGGADDEQNLWPQCYEQVNPDKSKQENGAHKKDRLETYIHAQLCKTPSEALLDKYQREIKFNWISFYHEIYGNEQPVVQRISRKRHRAHTARRPAPSVIRAHRTGTKHR